MLSYLVLASLAVTAYGAFLPPTIIKGIGQAPIVGGEPAEITDAPYQVVLLYGGSLRCGGSIATANVIVTAAHCVDGTSTSSWSIRAGSKNNNAGGQVIKAKSYVRHAQYNSQIDYDVAIIVLSEDISLDGTTTKAVPLADQGQEVADGSMALVTGWGSTSSGGGVVSSLRKVLLPVVNQQTCKDAYNGFNPITDRMICGGDINNGGIDACQGDSGGPFVVEGVLVGITSWGRGCAMKGYPGVWTRVPALRSWIDQQMP